MRVIHAGPMRGGRAVLTSLALALPALAALVAAPASSAQAPEEFVPGTEAIILGPLTPTLQFTHEDFQKGFSRTYTFPRVPICTTPLCDSGGTIKLTYVPAPDAPIQVNLEYWEVYDCSQFEDEPKTQKVTYTWSDDLPLGLLADPDGVFPAAEFYDPTADVKRSRSGHCDVDQGGEGPMSIRLKLVHTNPYTGDVHRTAYLMLDDFHEWNARVFAGPPSEGEVEVAVTPPEDYDGWMPAGVVAASDTPGKQLTVHVKVHQKGDSASTGKAQLRFGFTEVSREKGVCLNWPTTGADTKPDLRLRFTDESLGQPSPEGTSIETSGLVEELDLIVESFDFGAWGTLRISGKDKNKRDVIVRVRGKQNPDLTIPLDEDGNRVPDAWMPEAARGRTADSDDEHQSGNPNDGDGLTLYEEWRGLVVNGGHRRTNPSKKDFFVRDLIDDQRSHDALALLADAADLEVHALALGEMDGSRVINPNSSSGVSQHGVILDTYDDPREDPDYSQVVPVVPGMASGTPRTISKILISQRNIDRPDRVPGEAYTDAAAEIAHELLHACSVRHHGENDVEKVEWRNRKTHADEVRNGGEPRQVEVLRENGSRYAFENADVITVWLASANGQHSGDVGCLMRYHRADAVYEAPASFGSGKLPVRYKADGGPIGLSLCRSAIGTGINSYDHKVLKAAGVATDFPRWGDAAAGRGDCWSQININDRH